MVHQIYYCAITMVAKWHSSATHNYMTNPQACSSCHCHTPHVRSIRIFLPHDDDMDRGRAWSRDKMTHSTLSWRSLMQIIYLPTYLWLSLTQRPGLMDMLEEATWCLEWLASLNSLWSLGHQRGLGIGSTLSFQPHSVPQRRSLSFQSGTR